MFVACGEALMDVYVLGTTPTGLHLDARHGGSPFNVAVGLARLGRRSALLTGLSRDAAAPVEVVDTVGAGDTFQAALLTWLDEQQALSAASLEALDAAQIAALLRFAARASAITCSRCGADMPRRNELPGC